MNDLVWLNKDEFSNKLKMSFSEKVQEVYFCNFNLKSKNLERVIPEIADDYVAPWTEPGPCLKWYGIFEDIYFLLTARLGNNEIADVYLFLSDSQSIDWRIFKDANLTSLAKRLTWINGAEDASTSLFSFDDDHLRYEFYRAKNEKDAGEFKNYLINSSFPRELFIGQAENLKLIWVVEKEEKIVARYNSRYSCEKYAVRMSKQDNATYLVSCENDSEYSATIFRDGKMIN
ncbi:MAG: hypothetical protein K1X72_21280 [Pyrinomonadaceae bacterium]|nr:hypothetical protein [Pyrinomonadaceae bacterium]